MNWFRSQRVRASVAPDGTVLSELGGEASPGPVGERFEEERPRSRRGLTWVVFLMTLGLAPGAAGARTTAPDPEWRTAREAFLQAVAKQDDVAMLDALQAVARFDNVEVAELLLRYGLPIEDLAVNREVFRILTQLKDEPARKEILEACTKEKSWETRAAAVRIVASFGGDFVLSKLEVALSDKKWQVRASAVRAIAHTRMKRGIPMLDRKSVV